MTVQQDPSYRDDTALLVFPDHGKGIWGPLDGLSWQEVRIRER